MRHVRSRSAVSASALLTGLLITLAACRQGVTPGGERAAPRPRSTRPGHSGPWIAGLVADMSPQEKVGQLFVPYAAGRERAIPVIEKYHVGGFVYSAEDTRTPEQTAKLSNALQDASDLPLLLGIGEEKAAKYLTPIPSDRALAATGRPADARAAALVLNTESHAVGITPAYGPVTGTGALRLANRGQLRKDGAVKAVQDGADQLVDPLDLPRDYNAVLDAVRNGTIPATRLDEAVTRILRLKEIRGLFGDTRADPGRAEAIVGSPEDRAVVRSVAEHSITLVKNDRLLPLTGRTLVYVAGAKRGQVAKALHGAGVHLTGSPNRADVVLLSTHDAGAGTAAEVTAASRYGPVIVVALGDPADLAHLGNAAAALAAYSGSGPALDALARVVGGSLHPTGRLPVAVSAEYPAGHGLTF